MTIGSRSKIVLTLAVAMALLATTANAAMINVNNYNNKGTPTPEDPTALAGPAGGLGDTWNQFNTKTNGSALLDSAGATTSVGYSLNAGDAWNWGAPDLAMLHGGLTHFGKGADTTFTINGLTPGSLYDVWVASYAHNTDLGERASASGRRPTQRPPLVPR